MPPLSSWSGRVRKRPPARSEPPPSHIDHLLRLLAFSYIFLSSRMLRSSSVSFFFTFNLRLRYHFHRSVGCRQRPAVLTKQHHPSHHSLSASSSITLVCPPLRSKKSDSQSPSVYFHRLHTTLIAITRIDAVCFADQHESQQTLSRFRMRPCGVSSRHSWPSQLVSCKPQG